MKTELYQKVENYMLSCMTDSAHDKEHIYRVLYMALDIAKYENEVDMDILIISCLLHDIGRQEQFKDPKLCHAKIGSEKAYQYLIDISFSEEKANLVKSCILTHRFRSDNPPNSIEAKILFDADKLDVTGTLGIARTLLYNALVSEPLYSVDENRCVLNGENDKLPSFFREYKYKLEKLYDKFYTNRGMQIAKERQSSAIAFYTSMLNEVQDCYKKGVTELGDILS
ncbi:HD domain-containing protein [Anaeromicropila herbilytica]|uniref:Phosphohydrolase n=1 Tax=Anaeromicropila herbilytica TaxID=2785025 RepID=A0A7R7IFA8_9FIRM|nr:HD domain-containing protein [Anaeromicropila herbilytica]BCN32901.1 phosphohydrolase [Anaeromicropila herbilytica]